MNVIILFGVSLVGLITLLSFTLWEQRRGLVFYRAKRAWGDNTVLRIGAGLKTVPHSLRVMISRLLHAIILHISAWVLRAVRFVEQKLHRFVNMIKGRHDIHHGKRGSASLFLTSISGKNDDSSSQTPK